MEHGSLAAGESLPEPTLAPFHAQGCLAGIGAESGQDCPDSHLSSADIYDKTASELKKQGYDCECLGGGRISHQSEKKKIHVYGYSVGFGRANHSVTTEKLKAKYPDYEITWADEGY
nr:PREDICTED: 14 kDa phosphohistidine phosphatase [Struthio camelus australis]